MVRSYFIFQMELEFRCCVFVCSAKREMYDNLHLKSFESVPLPFWRNNELINRSLTCAYLPSQVITNKRWFAKAPQTTQYILWLIFYTSSQHIASHKSQHQHVIKGEQKKMNQNIPFRLRQCCYHSTFACDTFLLGAFLPENFFFIFWFSLCCD